MKFKHGMLLAALLSLPAMASAQGENLVNNGGFESVTGKPKKLGQIELAAPWKSPTGARADVFVGSGKVPAEIGAPDNFYGTESAAEGTNYAGIVAFSFGDKIARTYVMAKLNTPLKKGMKYCVKFSVVLSETSKYSCNQIGAKFTSKEFATDAKSSIIDKADVLHPNNKSFNAMFGWEKVCGTFTAEGGEKYITIGNFASNEDTKNERMKMPATFKGNTTQTVGAYYYIDDVSVTLLDDQTPCDCGVEEQTTTLPTMVYQRDVQIVKNGTPKQKIEAQTMFFAFGKANITDQGMAILDYIITELKANPTLNVTVNGYGDSFEKELSEKKEPYLDMDAKRSKAVQEYLIAKGISPSRIKTSNKGNDAVNPDIVAGDDKEMTLAKNRRVTISVN